MHKSFYHYLMKYREETPRDEIAAFANDAFADHSFPKGADEYDTLSRYLEMDVDYLPSMSVFDTAWEKYEQDELMV
ncbi:YozE family protein [Domibacillus aminovorans]|uniref:UPF0346 protein AWH48_03770 n=1 Tax=Domibacillus aminovorans TaxID=29332 RepID=A0A177L5G8_9BACI|nr:YozE family protein [Domibacillus aminovorans]OAH55803.1 hypothetical protein AWH48_03770 [Domibacillus aminovorans]OAH60940.1 hypothetical protein AWH49_14510 [Domibacillus aminovorans]